jgi:Leucine-rich repeat (LRR) protein
LASLSKLYAAEIGLGVLDGAVQNWENLEELDLSVNMLVRIPEELGNLPCLQWLSVHHNRVRTSSSFSTLSLHPSFLLSVHPSSYLLLLLPFVLVLLLVYFLFLFLILLVLPLLSLTSPSC